MVIAIDGPAGAGKTTAAKLLAEKLGFLYLDTGAMYRTVTLFAIKNSIDPDNESALVDALSKNFDIHMNGEKVYLNGEDVSEYIRSKEVAQLVSLVSSHKGVRDMMVLKQREFAIGKDIVVEGRDIGTVVFPQAEVKIFLKADVEQRALRRCKESGLDIKEVQQNIEQRDKLDTTRKVAPLKVAHGAIVVDNTNFTIQKGVDYLLQIVNERRSQL